MNALTIRSAIAIRKEIPLDLNNNRKRPYSYFPIKTPPVFRTPLMTKPPSPGPMVPGIMANSEINRRDVMNSNTDVPKVKPLNLSSVCVVFFIYRKTFSVLSSVLPSITLIESRERSRLTPRAPGFYTAPFRRRQGTCGGHESRMSKSTGWSGYISRWRGERSCEPLFEKRPLPPQNIVFQSLE